MHRFHLPPPQCKSATLVLTGSEAHHALRVLRVQRGEQVTVLDGAGGEFLCQIQNADRRGLELTVVKKQIVPPLPCQITLLQSIPKGKIIESIIQKAVELGAFRIVPILAERVVAQLTGDDAGQKKEKWQQVAIEAIKQCGAAWLPKVEAPVTPEQFIAQKESFDLSLVGSLQSDARHARECFQEFQARHGRLPASAAIWIGPEGDFTSAEMDAIKAAGALPLTLGRLVLRVETAAVYCLSILNYELQAAVNEIESARGKNDLNDPGA